MAASEGDPIGADLDAQRLVGSVHGIIIAAGVLVVSGATGTPEALEAGVYTVATVLAFWLADGWGHGLALRAAGGQDYGLVTGLKGQIAVMESILPPIAALAIAKVLGATDENAISIAIWICVVALGLLGAGVARREGLPAHRVAMTSALCAGVGLALVALKAVLH